MASALKFIVLLVLVCGLWSETNALKKKLLTKSYLPCRPPYNCCARCPYGWIRYGNRCYMFFYRRLSWALAERYCTYRGGNLASIPYNGVLYFLRGYVYRVTGAHRRVWLGGYDTVHERVWLWSNGDRFYFRKWARGQPNNRKGRQHCMEMNYSGRYINDTYCWARKHFFCVRNL